MELGFIEDRDLSILRFDDNALIAYDSNMRRNRLNGTLEIDSSYSDQLQLIDMQSNLIDSFTQRPGYPFQIL